MILDMVVQTVDLNQNEDTPFSSSIPSLRIPHLEAASAIFAKPEALSSSLKSSLIFRVACRTIFLSWKEVIPCMRRIRAMETNRKRTRLLHVGRTSRRNP